VTRLQSSLGRGFRTIRAMFAEEHSSTSAIWRCNFCLFAYYEDQCPLGWPIGTRAMQALLAHMSEHAVS